MIEIKFSLKNWLNDLNEIENLTGIDFFPELPDKLENELEKTSNYKHWALK